MKCRSDSDEADDEKDDEVATENREILRPKSKL